MAPYPVPAEYDQQWQNLQRDHALFPAWHEYVYGPDARNPSAVHPGFNRPASMAGTLFSDLPLEDLNAERSSQLLPSEEAIWENLSLATAHQAQYHSQVPAPPFQFHEPVHVTSTVYNIALVNGQAHGGMISHQQVQPHHQVVTNLPPGWTVLPVHRPYYLPSQATNGVPTNQPPPLASHLAPRNNIGVPPAAPQAPVGTQEPKIQMLKPNLILGPEWSWMEEDFCKSINEHLKKSWSCLAAHLPQQIRTAATEFIIQVSTQVHNERRRTEIRRSMPMMYHFIKVRDTVDPSSFAHGHAKEWLLKFSMSLKPHEQPFVRNILDAMAKAEKEDKDPNSVIDNFKLKNWPAKHGGQAVGGQAAGDRVTGPEAGAQAVKVQSSEVQESTVKIEDAKAK